MELKVWRVTGTLLMSIEGEGAIYEIRNEGRKTNNVFVDMKSIT